MIHSWNYARMQQRLGDRDLMALLQHWERAGVSFNAMARLLEADTGITVVGETVRRWVKSAQAA